MITIRDASVGEGSVVGELLRRSFEPEFLIASIYSHPFGDRVLEGLLDDGQLPNSISIRLAELNGFSVGCSIVSADSQMDNLDFIAVLPSVSGLGIGSKLLWDAEQRSGGNLGLEVFRRNVRVFDWYLRHGYSPVGERRMLVLDFGSVNSLQSKYDSWARGELEVRDNGFYRTSIESQSGNVEITLFGEDRIRLRSHPGMTVNQAIEIIRKNVPSRGKMIVFEDTTNEIENSSPAIEVLIRMKRMIEDE